ncbi:MAG: hypothetical protein NVSMB39_1250 [Candidatus Saccharimonadales bacterium]
MSSKVPPPTRTTRVIRVVEWARNNKLVSVLGGVIIGLLILILLLALSLCAPVTPAGTLGSAPGATGTASPSPLPTGSASAAAAAPLPDSSSASASVSPSPSQNCVAPPTGLNHQLSVTQVEPATNTDWLTQFKNRHGLARIDLNGAFVDAATLNKWIDALNCAGYYAAVRADSLFDQHMSSSDTDAYLQAVKSHGHLANWIIRSGPDCAQRLKVLNSTGIGVLTWGDWPLEGNTCRPTLPIYVPFPEPNSYGSVANYAKVAHDVFLDQHTSAWGAVQAYNNATAAPDLASHFPANAQRPSPAEVAGFAQQFIDQGVKNIEIYTEGPDAKDTAYLGDVIDAVAARFG